MKIGQGIIDSIDFLSVSTEFAVACWGEEPTYNEDRLGKDQSCANTYLAFFMHYA